jgi:two-component SAPR family response regulator
LIKAIAIDDEPLALKIVESFCGKLEDVELMKTFTSQEQALSYMENYPVDLLFLDIQMPAKDGITFYKHLEHKPPVIFTTAYGSYAVEGFNVAAVDYLVKPFSFERFEKACDKARKTLQLRRRFFIFKGRLPVAQNKIIRHPVYTIRRRLHPDLFPKHKI